MPKTEWIVETGDYRKKVSAYSAKLAAITAFKRKPPQSAGELTRVESLHHGIYFYLDSRDLLKHAGYEV